MSNSTSNVLSISEALEFQYYGNDTITDVEVLDGVRKIENRAFKDCANLKNITFSNSLETIEEGAFCGCENLEEVILPKNVKRIGKRAFADCKRLKRIVIPEECEEIAWGAFAGCDNLREVILPDSLREISEELFLNCKKLKSVRIPKHITTLPDGVFKGCANLDMELNQEITKLGDRVFEDCYKLKNYPTQIREAGNNCFRNCRSLEKVDLSPEINSLADRMFDGCVNLHEINYPSNKTIRIGEACFRNCKSLKSIPSFVENFSPRGFENCTGLEEIDVIDPVIPFACFRGCKNLKIINGQESIRRINAYAFSACENLEDFTVRNAEVIGAEAFSHCKNLRKIYSRAPIKRIEPRAFYNCSLLEDNDFIYAANYIGREAFRYCDSIRRLVIPDNLKEFGDYAFASMGSLERIEVSPLNATFMTPDNKILIHKIQQKLMLYAAGLKDKSYSLKDYNVKIDFLNREVIQPIEGIGVAAFAGAKNLEELTICGCTRNIESNAFEECDNLKKLNAQSIPFGTSFFLNIRDHGRYYFSENSKQPLELPFKKVEFLAGEDPGHIEENALKYFTNVSEITLPEKGIHSIYPEAFVDCNIKELYVPDGVSDINIGAIPEKTIVKFSNGLEVDNFLELSSNNDYVGNYKLYTLRDGVYYIEQGDKLTKLTKEDIDRVCSHSEEIRDNPVLYLDFMNDLFNHDMAIKQLFNGILMSNMSLDNRKILFENIDKKDKFALDILAKSLLLEDSDYYTKHLLEKENFSKCTNYIELLRKNNITNPLFCNKILMACYDVNCFEELINNHYDTLEKVLQNGDLLDKNKGLSSDEKPASIKTILDDDTFGPFVKYLDTYGVKDRFLFKKPIMAIAKNPSAEKFFKYFDANSKRLIKDSKILDNYGTAKDNLNDLLSLLSITGAFSNDPVVRQRAITFITEKMFAEKLPSGEDNPYRIVGDDIHRVFNLPSVREETDLEFITFFMENFQELMNEEKIKSGFIQRVYTNFRQISETCTSNKGFQRKLKVTIEKCRNYLNTAKFDDIKPEEKEFANCIGEWFDENETWLLAKKIYDEAIVAPRNIFTKIEYDEDGNAIYDNNPEEDLKDEIRDGFYYEWLPKQDYDNFVLGKYCNCCAHLEGAGAGIMRASIILDCCQNLVIRNNYGRIIAKSTLYVNRHEGYAVFNNVESSLNYRGNEDLSAIYEAFMRGAKAFIQKYNQNNEIPINEMLIGGARNTLSNYLIDSIHPVREVKKCIAYGNFWYPDTFMGHYAGDCHSAQRLVLKI